MAELNAERSKLLAQLAVVDGEIAQIAGGKKSRRRIAAAAPAVAGRGRPGRKPQLTEAITRVLADAGTPLRVADIAEELEKRDFQTRSKNLRNLVREALSRTPGIVRVTRGSYTVRK
ncbi:MAG TPA: hypothetical protein P5137_07695 [Candidatus Brocadiia bacterium]|nr:hypothetical protein [Candidatus Brocadiia bacterium]